MISIDNRTSDFLDVNYTCKDLLTHSAKYKEKLLSFSEVKWPAVGPVTTLGRREEALQKGIAGLKSFIDS